MECHVAIEPHRISHIHHLTVGGVNRLAHFRTFSGQFGLILERFESVMPLYFKNETFGFF